MKVWMTVLGLLVLAVAIGAAIAFKTNPRAGGARISDGLEAIFPQPVKQYEDPEVEEGVFEFNGEELATVLRMLAKKADLNIVVSDQVSETVTLRLSHTDALGALRIICASKKLAVTFIDDIMFVKTQAEFDEEPTFLASITLKNSVAEKVVSLAEFAMPDAATYIADARTNSILFRTKGSQIQQVQHLLEWLDRVDPNIPWEPAQNPIQEAFARLQAARQTGNTQVESEDEESSPADLPTPAIETLGPPEPIEIPSGQ